MPSGYDIWGVVAGVLGLLGLLPMFCAFVGSQLPSTKFKILHDTMTETESLFRTVTEEGLLKDAVYVVQTEGQLSQMRSEVEDLRAVIYRATSFLQELREATRGLSRQISVLCKKVQEVRSSISTTSAEERRRLMSSDPSDGESSSTGTDTGECLNISDGTSVHIERDGLAGNSTGIRDPQGQSPDYISCAGHCHLTHITGLSSQLTCSSTCGTASAHVTGYTSPPNESKVQTTEQDIPLLPHGGSYPTIIPLRNYPLPHARSYSKTVLRPRIFVPRKSCARLSAPVFSPGLVLRRVSRLLPPSDQRKLLLAKLNRIRRVREHSDHRKPFSSVTLAQRAMFGKHSLTLHCVPVTTASMIDSSDVGEEWEDVDDILSV